MGIMKLREYLELIKTRPSVWARSVGLPPSGVDCWIKGTTPTIKNIFKIQKATEGAVRPDDWNETP